MYNVLNVCEIPEATNFDSGLTEVILSVITHRVFNVLDIEQLLHIAPKLQ